MTTFDKQVEEFIKFLQNYEKLPDVFNPWGDVDDFDRPNGVNIRCNNLRQYLLSRKNAEIVLLAEAPGYQGCHFSGIPLMSERIIIDLPPYQRSSDSEKITGKSNMVVKYGFTEPSSTIMYNSGYWDKCVCWNIFPFHPYPQGNVRKNDTPDDQEICKTFDILQRFLALFPNAKVISVGNRAEFGLRKHDIKAFGHVRHPSNGGKWEFFNGLAKFCK